MTQQVVGDASIGGGGIAVAAWIGTVSGLLQAVVLALTIVILCLRIRRVLDEDRRR